MSADAKIWQDTPDDEQRSGWASWCGLHDGPCAISAEIHRQGATLGGVIADIETCMGQELRWQFRTYPDGNIGLVGYCT